MYLELRKGTKMKTASYPGWALEHVEVERKRYHVEPHVKLRMARNVCRCGSITVMVSDTALACVACGATAKQRTANPNGNLEAFC